MRIDVDEATVAAIRAEYALGGTTIDRLAQKYGIKRGTIWYTLRARRLFDEKYRTRFWARVNKDGPNGCWIWTAAASSAGYGQLRMNGKAVFVHRLSYEWAHGTIPAGYDVCHTCDNPPCVNPAHLFLGKAKDNIADMFRKGRNPDRSRTVKRGADNESAKFTNEQVSVMRQEYATGGTSQRGLARKYGAGKSTIARILRGQTYRQPIK